MTLLPDVAMADAGPPFLTNDPGTPGNGNWEINFGSMATVDQHAGRYQLPQLDVNLGLGDRVQLTYEVPYVVQSVSDQPRTTGWGNAFAGVKWRFFDGGEDGWKVSTFPLVEIGASAHSQQAGIASADSRLLVPVEISRRAGPVAVAFETGIYSAHAGFAERIVGLVVGGPVSNAFELDTELYNDHLTGPAISDTTLGIGGRYVLSRSFIALFMAGRSIGATASGHTLFIGYIGVQVLLSDFGRSFATGP